jgi:hypothetical protein
MAKKSRTRPYRTDGVGKPTWEGWPTKAKELYVPEVRRSDGSIYRKQQWIDQGATVIAKPLCLVCGGALVPEKLRRGYRMQCFACGSFRVYFHHPPRWWCAHPARRFAMAKDGTWINERCAICAYSAFFYPPANALKDVVAWRRAIALRGAQRKVAPRGLRLPVRAALPGARTPGYVQRYR